MLSRGFTASPLQWNIFGSNGTCPHLSFTCVHDSDWLFAYAGYSGAALYSDVQSPMPKPIFWQHIKEDKVQEKEDKYRPRLLHSFSSRKGGKFKDVVSLVGLLPRLRSDRHNLKILDP